MAKIKGDEQDNELLGKQSDDTISGLGGNDTILEYFDTNDKIYGGDGDDYIHDYGGKNTLYGDDGNDLFVLDDGQSKVIGGKGFDTISFSYADKAVKFDMSDGEGSLHTTGGKGTFTFKQVEDALGTSLDDVIKGDGLDNKLDGGNGGSDTLNGLDGDDWLAGNDGDKLTGGAGGDAFQATSAFGAVSTVFDFKSGTDILLMSSDAFDLMGTGDAQSFHGIDIMQADTAGIQIGKGHVAGTTDVRLIYDTDAGILYYDPDGSGGSSPAELLDLKGAKVELSDLFVF